MAEQDVRERILAAATSLFARKGYGSTSIREVVEAAGITKPTLYYHFDGKEALFLHTVHTHLARFGRLLEQSIEESGSVRERLTRFAHRYVSESITSPDAVKLLISVKQPFDQEQPKVDMMSVHLTHTLLLGSLIGLGIERGELRNGIDPGAATLAFLGGLHLLIAAQLHGHPVPDGMIDQILDLYFTGAAA